MEAKTYIGLTGAQQLLVRKLHRRKNPTRCSGHALKTARVLAEKDIVRVVAGNYEGRKLVALWVRL